MNKLFICDMREDDIPAILEIEKISFTIPWSEQDFLNELYKKNAFPKVAVFERNIIGYICVNYHLHEAQILNLAVHKDFRRQGVATILMDEAIRELNKKGCAFIYLKVRVSNTSAQRFYELFGFKVESIRKKYYGYPDEDALLMMRRL
ncbi:MAG TPA: ribosomal protein S18-alanine N-acetyltransferase [Thermodesulfovibrionales bacterium]|nr:ribosomal protein S18-alanine N-acetyltransferase [Thermodesulfovibrionales bacterium]